MSIKTDYKLTFEAMKDAGKIGDMNTYYKLAKDLSKLADLMESRDG